MIALRTTVRHSFRDAEVVGRCLPGRYDKECKYDLRYSDGSIRGNVPESEIARMELPRLMAIAG